MMEMIVTTEYTSGAVIAHVNGQPTPLTDLLRVRVTERGLLHFWLLDYYKSTYFNNDQKNSFFISKSRYFFHL